MTLIESNTSEEKYETHVLYPFRVHAVLLHWNPQIGHSSLLEWKLPIYWMGNTPFTQLDRIRCYRFGDNPEHDILQ